MNNNEHDNKLEQRIRFVANHFRQRPSIAQLNRGI